MILHFISFRHLPDLMQRLAYVGRTLVGLLGLFLVGILAVVMISLVRHFQKKINITKDLPSGAIRSLAMGSAEVTGHLSAPYTIQTLIGQQQCYMYRIVISIDPADTDSSSYPIWQKTITPQPLQLTDDTGSIVVNTNGMPIELKTYDSYIHDTGGETSFTEDEIIATIAQRISEQTAYTISAPSNSKHTHHYLDTKTHARPLPRSTLHNNLTNPPHTSWRKNHDRIVIEEYYIAPGQPVYARGGISHDEQTHQPVLGVAGWTSDPALIIFTDKTEQQVLRNNRLAYYVLSITTLITLGPFILVLFFIIVWRIISLIR